MSEINWLQMLEYQQNIHHFARTLLLQGRNCTLSTSELEILSLLYLHPENNTPLALSRQSGMKKEAISRIIRQLFEIDCLEKQLNPQDERSYSLHLTKTGLQKLHENYGFILQPLYDLHREMGDEFQLLFDLMEKANRLLKKPQ